MRVTGSVPAQARKTFATHFRRAYAQGWTWSVARTLARPMVQNGNMSFAFVPAIRTVEAA